MLRLRYNTEDWRNCLNDAIDSACREHGLDTSYYGDECWNEAADQLCSDTLAMLDKRDIEYERAHQQSRGTHVIVQDGEPHEIEVFDECLAEAMEAAEKEVREIVEADAKAVNEYEIGGLSVHMTTPQANRWNRGELTEDDLDAIKVFRVTDEGAGWGFRDGNLVLTQEPAEGEWITMREALADADLANLLEHTEAEFSHGPVA